jgi:hypothetical protein
MFFPREMSEATFLSMMTMMTIGTCFRYAALISATMRLPFSDPHYSLHMHLPLRSINRSASGKGAFHSAVMQNASTVIRPRPFRFQPAASSPPGDQQVAGADEKAAPHSSTVRI